MLDVWSLKMTTEFRPGRVNIQPDGTFLYWFDWVGQWLRLAGRADITVLLPKWTRGEGPSNCSIDSMDATRITREWATRVGAPPGLMYYSNKRGALQHRYHELGVPMEELASQTLLKSRGTMERYVDRGRHWHRQVQTERREHARGEQGREMTGERHNVWGGPPPELEVRLRAQERA